MNISEELLLFRDQASSMAEARDYQGAIFILLLSLVGIVGNSILIDVYIHTRKRVMSTYFIILLGIIDLTICAFIMPLRAAILLTPVPFGVCCLYLSSAYLCVSISIYLFFLIAIDRYQSVCRLGQPLFTVKHLKAIFIYMFLCNLSVSIIASLYLKGDVKIVDGNRTLSLLMREDFPCYVNSMLNHKNRIWDCRYIMHFSLAVIFTTFMLCVSGLYVSVFKALKHVDAFRARSKGSVHPWTPSGSSNPLKLEARPCYFHVSSTVLKNNERASTNMNGEAKIVFRNGRSTKRDLQTDGNNAFSKDISDEERENTSYKQMNGFSGHENEVEDDIMVESICNEIDLPHFQTSSNETDDGYNRVMKGNIKRMSHDLSNSPNSLNSRGTTSTRCGMSKSVEEMKHEINDLKHNVVHDIQKSSLPSSDSANMKQTHPNNGSNKLENEAPNVSNKSHFQKAMLGGGSEKRKRRFISKCKKKQTKKRLNKTLSGSTSSLHTDSEFFHTPPTSDEEEDERPENIKNDCRIMSVWATCQSSRIPRTHSTMITLKTIPLTTDDNDCFRVGKRNVLVRPKLLSRPDGVSKVSPQVADPTSKRDDTLRKKNYKPQAAGMSSKILRRLFLVTLFYYLCWLPFYLIELGIVPYDNIMINTFLMANMVNPLIHLTTSKPFRQEFLYRLKTLPKRIIHHSPARF